MDFQMSKEEFVSLLGRLSIPNAVEQVNDSIVHIKLWHNGKIFRARFVGGDGIYVFTNFFGGLIYENILRHRGIHNGRR